MEYEGREIKEKLYELQYRWLDRGRESSCPLWG